MPPPPPPPPPAPNSGFYYVDVTWASWRLRSSVTRLFVEQTVRTKKENFKALHYWTFGMGTNWWPVDSLHKGSVMRKAFACHDVVVLQSRWRIILPSPPPHFISHISFTSFTSVDLIPLKICLKQNEANPGNHIFFTSIMIFWYFHPACCHSSYYHHFL